MNALPKDLAILKKDFDTTVKSCLKSSLEKFDLVSREEFDIQARALQRAQEKLFTLKERVEELEKKSNGAHQ